MAEKEPYKIFGFTREILKTFTEPGSGSGFFVVLLPVTFLVDVVALIIMAGQWFFGLFRQPIQEESNEKNP